MTSTPIPVTQRARNAAADRLEILGLGRPYTDSANRVADDVRNGRNDDHPWAQAFARFEHSLTAGDEKVDRAVKFIDDFFRPWGASKTAWWEGEVSDDAAFTATNALKHVANILRAPPSATKSAGESGTETIDAWFHGYRQAVKRILALIASVCEVPPNPVIMKANPKSDAQELRRLAAYIASDTHLKPGNRKSWADFLEGIARHYPDKATLPGAR